MDEEKVKDKEEKAQFTKQLANHIQKMRKQSGLTQEKLAAETGIDDSYIGHLEMGVYTPTLYIVWKLAKAMKMNISEFTKNFPED